MYGKGTLAQTGVGFTILGVSASLSLVAALAVTLVIVGALGYRYATRSKRHAA
ncbi:hypothetical protein ABT160_34920 [Streptomyces sp. NPDC001941]|uniref:hypothetical protein n=1 Tax=Streptomyces sp. NPDC001941 TaxID=3154659 RepID=UPI00332F5841